MARVAGRSPPLDAASDAPPRGTSCKARARSATASTELPSARLRYTRAKALGRGAFGNVYKGVLDEECAVAVKVLRAGSVVAARQFRRELRRYSQLACTGVVSFYGAARSGDGTETPDVCVTELMRGGSLRSALDAFRIRNERMPVALALRVAEMAANGLAAIHARGYSHGDVKPSNVLLSVPIANSSAEDAFGALRAKFVDFGLSRDVHARDADAAADAADAAAIAAAGAVSGAASGAAPPIEPLGTPAYLAPEAWRGRSALRDAQMALAADVYALGIALYELEAGVVPWAGLSEWAIFGKVYHSVERPGWPRDTRDSGMRAIVEQCWAHDHRNRPAARDVAAQLRELRRAAGLQSPPASSPAHSDPGHSRPGTPVHAPARAAPNGARLSEALRAHRLIGAGHSSSDDENGTRGNALLDCSAAKNDLDDAVIHKAAVGSRATAEPTLIGPINDAQQRIAHRICLPACDPNTAPTPPLSLSGYANALSPEMDSFGVAPTMSTTPRAKPPHGQLAPPPQPAPSQKSTDARERTPVSNNSSSKTPSTDRFADAESSTPPSDPLPAPGATQMHQPELAARSAVEELDAPPRLPSDNTPPRPPSDNAPPHPPSDSAPPPPAPTSTAVPTPAPPSPAPRSPDQLLSMAVPYQQANPDVPSYPEPPISSRSPSFSASPAKQDFISSSSASEQSMPNGLVQTPASPESVPSEAFSHARRRTAANMRFVGRPRDPREAAAAIDTLRPLSPLRTPAAPPVDAPLLEAAPLRAHHPVDVPRYAPHAHALGYAHSHPYAHDVPQMPAQQQLPPQAPHPQDIEYPFKIEVQRNDIGGVLVGLERALSPGADNGRGVAHALHALAVLCSMDDVNRAHAVDSGALELGAVALARHGRASADVCRAHCELILQLALGRTAGVEGALRAGGACEGALQALRWHAGSPDVLQAAAMALAATCRASPALGSIAAAQGAPHAAARALSRAAHAPQLNSPVAVAALDALSALAAPHADTVAAARALPDVIRAIDSFSAHDVDTAAADVLYASIHSERACAALLADENAVPAIARLMARADAGADPARILTQCCDVVSALAAADPPRASSALQTGDLVKGVLLALSATDMVSPFDAGTVLAVRALLCMRRLCSLGQDMCATLHLLRALDATASTVAARAETAEVAVQAAHFAGSLVSKLAGGPLAGAGLAPVLDMLRSLDETWLLDVRVLEAVRAANNVVERAAGGRISRRNDGPFHVQPVAANRPSPGRARKLFRWRKT